MPRHLAGAPRPPRHVAGTRSGAHLVDPSTPLLSSSLRPVHLRRIGAALCATLAALPLLVIDNLPATADAPSPQVVADAPVPVARAGVVGADVNGLPFAVRRANAATSTTEAPTTTVVVETTEAPTTTEAPPEPAPEPVAMNATPITAAPPPPTTASPPPPPVTSAPRAYADPADPATWDRLAQCESGGRWSLNSGNGYYGGLQFSLASWRGVGGSGYPHENSREEQIRRGQILQSRHGWGQWPGCTRKLGYR